jgi:hypothetical protein
MASRTRPVFKNLYPTEINVSLSTEKSPAGDFLSCLYAAMDASALAVGEVSNNTAGGHSEVCQMEQIRPILGIKEVAADYE